MKSYEIRKDTEGYTVWVDGTARTPPYQREATALLELWKFVQADLEAALLDVSEETWRSV